jgi:cell division protein FtsW
MSASTQTWTDASVVTPQRGVVDWQLLGAVGLLVGLGLLMITSASSLNADAQYGNALHYVGRQLAGIALGTTIGAAAMFAPWRWVRNLSAWPLYIGTLCLLLAVLGPMGHSAKGATRWLHLGPVNFQPSELAKLALVTMLAHYLAANQGRLRDFFGVVIPAVGLVAPLLVFIVFQRDFGTTVVLVGLTGVLLFVAGLQWQWVASLGAATVGLLAGLVLVEPYRIRRLVSFLDPFAEPDGAGYQVVQGWIALATGGMTGTGLASGVAQRGFLPEAHTDFVVAVIGEELGAVGFAVTLLLLMVVVWRGAAIAAKAPSMFHTLTAIGITAMLAAQAIINVGVVCGLMPAKGLVLPFLSYGASAAVIHLAAIGLLLRIGMESQPEEA